jgi:hypothetical protein
MFPFDPAIMPLRLDAQSLDDGNPLIQNRRSALAGIRASRSQF